MQRRIFIFVLCFLFLATPIVLSACNPESDVSSPVDQSQGESDMEDTSQDISTPGTESEPPVDDPIWDEDPVEIPAGLTNLSEGTYYGFSFTGALTVTKDDGKVLTHTTAPAISCSLKDVPLTHGDWYGGSHTTSLFEHKESAYYLKNDFGFPALLHTSVIVFDDAKDIPVKVELYLSDDGYNFNTFAGEYTLEMQGPKAVFSLDLETPRLVKAVKYYIYTPASTNNILRGIYNIGEQKAKTELLSKDAPYTHNAKDTSVANRDPELMKLTDTVFGENESVDKSYVILTPDAQDPLTKRSAVEIILDLKETKNVSEVHVSAIVLSTLGTSEDIQYIQIDSSIDGEDYRDFGTAFAEAKHKGIKAGGHTRVRYSAWRNHTVEARYIRLKLFANKNFNIDEISVYGGEQYAEPEYDFSPPEDKVHSDILDKVTLTDISNNQATYLTNGDYRTASPIEIVDSVATLTAEIKDKSKLSAGALTGATVTIPQADFAHVKDVKVTLIPDNGEPQTYLFSDNTTHSLAGLTTLIAYFDIPVSSKVKVTYEVTMKEGYSKDTVNLSGVQLYCGSVQSPVIAGGFYAYFLDYTEGFNRHHFFGDYRIYMMLKGYKELGMTYIVAPQNMEYGPKKILIEPGEALKAKGYTKTISHGSQDLNEAILTAADKLGLKVYISTLYSETYPNIPGSPDDKIAYYKEVVKDAELLIELLYDRYKSHPSLDGFYIVDETCDDWLRKDNTRGVDAYRTLYKGQSKAIRAQNKNLKVMIAPATWRSDTPQGYENTMYALLKPEKSGQRPVVDIVALQDCLGREASIIVGDAVYRKYEEYEVSVSRAVRNAGATFFNDAEVFDVGYKGKQYHEIINSLYLQYKYAAGIIVFDLPHYLSNQGRGSFDSYYYYEYDSILSQYAKYMTNHKA